MQVFPIVQALALLMLANGTPVIAKKTFGSRLALPLDAGLQFVDGQPLFGTSKTIRGILSSIVVTAGLAPLLWMSVGTGALIAGFAMIGDLFSSFLKRRLKFPPSSKAIGLDQIPESLFPLLACQKALSLTLADVLLCVGIFVVAELMLSRFLYKWHVRDRPY